jgi:hypothetical protein
MVVMAAMNRHHGLSYRRPKKLRTATTTTTRPTI